MIEEFEIRTGNGFFTGRVETYKWNGKSFDLIHVQQSLLFIFIKKIEKFIINLMKK